MSREIYIGYRSADGSEKVDIDVRAPYFLFGTERTSKAFWSLAVWKDLGVLQLSELGTSSPVYFDDWEMMDELAREIRLFQDNLASIDFSVDEKSWFLAHLVYCHCLLISTAPKDSVPWLMIG